MDDQDMPLNALFERARSIYEDAEAEQSKDAIRWLQAAVARAAAVGIFSSNEEVDDIATADLKYLLLPYMQGYLLSDTREKDPHKRLAALDEAKHELTRFLKDIRYYKALSQEQQAALGSSGPLDAATKRVQKIRRFQLERAIKAELDTMNMQALRSRRVRQVQQEEGDAAEQQDGDEAAERETWLKQIALASLKAAERLCSIQQEVDVLKHAASLPEDVRSRPASNQGASTEVMASLRQAAAALSMNPAEQIRANVFRPTHILPTVTLAEQADMEMAAAQRVSTAQAKADAGRAAAKAADKNGEQETLRQRAWDDWKDDNPRGAGNSKLRPTA